MQAHYAETFRRGMGCTEAEWLGWLGWLPRAVGSHPMQRDGSNAHITVGQGSCICTGRSCPLASLPK